VVLLLAYAHGTPTWRQVEDDNDEVPVNTIEEDELRFPTTGDDQRFRKIERKGDGVAIVTFDSKPINAVDNLMIKHLNTILNIIDEDASIKVILFQSKHELIFLAHAGEDGMKKDGAGGIEAFSKALTKVLQRISNLPQVTIAIIEGSVKGAGFEFVLACDMRYASRGYANFQLMEVGLGVTPMGGSTQRLTHLAGVSNALDIMLGAHQFDADAALRYNIINRAYEKNVIEKKVKDLTQRIAKFPLPAIQAIKKSAYASIGSSIEDGLIVESAQLKKTAAGAAGVATMISGMGDVKFYGNWDSHIVDIAKGQNQKNGYPINVENPW